MINFLFLVQTYTLLLSKTTYLWIGYLYEKMIGMKSLENTVL